MRLLCVDDEPQICALVAQVAQECGFEVETASNTAKVADICQQFSPDVIVLDLAMPESDGIEGLVALAAAKCEAKIILMSGFAGFLLSSAAKLGTLYNLRIVDSLPKPFHRQALRDALNAQRPAGPAAGRREPVN